MSEGSSCPHCGFPLAESGGSDAMASVYGEVRRIRELAEQRATSAAEERVAALTSEVQELRATVARLRGAPGGLPAPRSPVTT